MPYYRPAIKVGLSVHYIQPPLMSWGFDNLYSSVVNTPPKPSRKYALRHKKIGRTIDIEGIAHSADISDTREELETLEGMFEGDSRGKFDFYIWHDRYLKDCICTSFSYDRTDRPSNVIRWSATIEATNPLMFDTPTLGAGPYEDQSYGGDTGAPVIPSVGGEMAVFNVPFPNVLSTPQKFELDPAFPDATSATLFQVAFMGCSGYAGTGTTIIRFNKTGLADATGLALSFDQTQDQDAKKIVTGDFDINLSGGETIFCFSEAVGCQPIDLVVAAYFKR